ncbi:MAG: uridine phosphorylase [Rhodothermales bacterium]
MLQTLNHITTEVGDFAGNGSYGRYVFLSGSGARAKRIAENHFANLVIRKSDRGHDLYLGTIDVDGQSIDVASISTGMGVSSIEIILSELIFAGARRFLRIGTCGSLQPEKIRVPSAVIVTAAVRDEKASADYAPIEVPAVATPEYVEYLKKAAISSDWGAHTYCGVVHCKSTLYGREFGYSPLKEVHDSYIKNLTNLGVLATEMESSLLFILGMCHNKNVSPISINTMEASHSNKDISVGTLLAVIGDDQPFSEQKDLKSKSVEKIIEIALNFVRLHFKSLNVPA